MTYKKLLSKTISINLSFLLLLQHSMIAGDIVSDVSANSSFQATVEKAPNGIPVVNIVKPNEKGLSHNKFSDYNVNKEGVILNNSNQREVNTQLAGYIYGNKNLVWRNTASTILNEVTSRNKTELRGFTEVAGDRANVVVANPDGIYINGAGFINTQKATITTGNISTINGNINQKKGGTFFIGFSVNNGTTINKQTVLSSITGNKVNVNVGNNTHLKGALLASGEFQEDGSFVDNKNLNFSTNTLTFGNLSNTTYFSNQSIGGSLNYNLTDSRIVNTKEKKDIEKGISSVKYNSDKSLSVNASKTLATLGQGNINIKDTANSDDLERLNTDTSKINKDLYSSSINTSVDATLDTRLLPIDGLNQIKDEARVSNLFFYFNYIIFLNIKNKTS